MVIADDHSNLRHNDVVILLMVNDCYDADHDDDIPLTPQYFGSDSIIRNSEHNLSKKIPWYPWYSTVKNMQRFRTALQFFRCAGYVALTVDHGIITTFHTCFNNGGISRFL